MLILHADGGCSPNPGAARYGVVIRHNGRVVDRVSKKIGYGTCNVAEWRAAIAALDYAVGFTLFNPQPVELFMDSRIVVNQLSGRWKKTRHEVLRPLSTQAEQLINVLKEQGCTVLIRWIPREQNTDADALT